MKLCGSKQLQGQGHDGQTIPSEPYGFCMQDKLVKLSSRKREVVESIRKHLGLVFSKLNAMARRYESMTPFTLVSETKEEAHDIAVDVELGLVYQVISVRNGSVQSNLLYSFCTPLDFLDFGPHTVPDCRKAGRNSTVPNNTSTDDLCSCDDDDDDDDDCCDGPEGPTCSDLDHGAPVNLMCLGVDDSYLSHPRKMAVGARLDVSCEEVDDQYLPAQFQISNDTGDNVHDKEHVVSIRCLGLGPNKWFLAIYKNEKGNWTFRAEEADMDDKTDFVPMDKKFKFILTLKEGLCRFKALSGDYSYLAFESTGKQVTEKDVLSKQSQFWYTPVQNLPLTCTVDI